MDKDNAALPKTNIAKLHDRYANGEAFYYKGVGSNFLTKPLGGLSGLGGKRRIRSAYDDLAAAYNAASEKDRVIDIFGFSRGAAISREFVNEIKEKGIPDYSKPIGTRLVRDYEAERNNPDRNVIYKEVTVYENFKDVKIRFLGLFDTVASFGIPGNDVDPGYNLTVEKESVQQTRHAVAADEFRDLFDLQSILEGKDAEPPPNMVEKVFRGAHSDVGGGYKATSKKSNKLANIPLNWIYNEAKNVGVQFKPLKEEDTELPEIDQMTEEQLKKQYIHDSRIIKIKKTSTKKRTIYYPNKPEEKIKPKITGEPSNDNY